MLGLYSKPLRVYIILIALALWGLFSGLSLPVSLFPMSSQVNVQVRIPYGSLSSDQFFELYGKGLESSLQVLKADGIPVSELTADYKDSAVRMQVSFSYGADSEKAIREVDNIVKTRFAAADESVRRSISVGSWSKNSGFFSLSFYSPLRSIDEMYTILEPIIAPITSKIEETSQFGLFNPNSKEVTLIINPEKLAQFGLTPGDVQSAVEKSVKGLNGGSLKMGENNYRIELPKQVDTVAQLGLVRIDKYIKSQIYLKDVAEIKVAVSEDNTKKFKTNGVDSLILYAQPKPGSNIKHMADQIMDEVHKVENLWPADIKYQVLVNPSDSINESISGVIHEVILAALFAVIVLYLFIGSFKNVVTAAIEIPISLLMAFILMKLVGMNINMISLGGLALSAGMNVDASVVVLENIFRHFQGKKANLTFTERTNILMEAVNEVKLPIIASTVASLVVFAPLVFTHGLTNALLGDLAKAVIFSHGLSAVVALVLVPTIRLQIMAYAPMDHVESPLEKYFLKVESFYEKSLKAFLLSRKMQICAMGAVLFLLPALIYLVVPRLDKEIIGRPQTAMLILGMWSPDMKTMKQAESEQALLEQQILKKYGDKISYTFVELESVEEVMVMLRLKDKRDAQELMKDYEKTFKSTPTKSYWASEWNPSELDMPESYDGKVEVTGGTPENSFTIAQDFHNYLKDNHIYNNRRTSPNLTKQKSIEIRDFKFQQEVLSRYDISNYLRAATTGIYVDHLVQNQQEVPIYLRIDKSRATNITQISALPVGFENRIIPLGALAEISIRERLPNRHRENQRDIITIRGKVSKDKVEEVKKVNLQFSKAITLFQEKIKNMKIDGPRPTLTEAIPDPELQEALKQLQWAVLISIVLVFLTMVLQLGNVIQSLLVLVAIPLGFIGVILSLWIFRSTLSLNSGLGTILLNGIAVANSIILVDFIQKQFNSGHSALHSTLTAATTRLRPILMTSTTTVLGMLPVAFGLGEGGKILQPLGIAVCGGLWVSMLLTLFFVPALQYIYLSRIEVKAKKRYNERPAQLPEMTQ